MNKAIFNKTAILPLVFAPLLVLSSGTYASGSFSGGGGAVVSPEQKQYHAGKSVLRKKLKCPGCALDGKKINKSTAPEVLSQLKSGDFGSVLAASEQQALTTYLTRRYKLN